MEASSAASRIMLKADGRVKGVVVGSKLQDTPAEGQKVKRMLECQRGGGNGEERKGEKIAGPMAGGSGGLKIKSRMDRTSRCSGCGCGYGCGT